MTDVLARARELVKQSSMPSVNLGEISGQLSNISQAVASGYTAQRDADPASDSILIHYRDVDRRHESFCQHGGWKLEKPSPQDLAEAGFFYAPLQGCEDRVACYACGKVNCICVNMCERGGARKFTSLRLCRNSTHVFC